MKQGQIENIASYIEEQKSESRQEGKLEGRLEGILEGILEGKLETARALLKQGVAVPIIQAATGLSIEKIESCLDS